jgi:hypothetical protein
MAKIKSSGDYFTSHSSEIPLLLFVFAIDDHTGTNIYPAIWSALLAAHEEGVGDVITTVLRYEADLVMEPPRSSRGRGLGHDRNARARLPARTLGRRGRPPPCSRGE